MDEPFEPDPTWGPQGTYEQLAIELLDHLEPERYAVNASPFGLLITSRLGYVKPTPWERELLTRRQPIPAAWIGYLSAISPPRKGFRMNSSKGGSTRSSGSYLASLSKKEEGDGSLSTPSSMTRVSQCDGRRLTEQETLDI